MNLRAGTVPGLTFLFFFTIAPSGTNAAAAGALEDWKPEWEQTLEAAKKEGEVVLYTDPEHEVMLEGFKRKFPEIKIRVRGSESVQIGPLLLAEHRARKHIADIYKGGLTTQVRLLYKNRLLAPMRPALILPEVVDESKWYQGRHVYGDPEGKYIFAFEMSVRDSGVAYNTNLVNPAQIQSYWDLLDPRWKGKIVSLDPKARGPISNNLRYFYYNPQLGPEFIRRLLGDMDVTLGRNDQQMMDWLATGKFALYLAPRGTDVAKAQGLPVDWLPRPPKETAAVDLGQSAISLLKTAPHPNAAKVLLNWFFSREGQLAFQSFSPGIPGRGGNSAREDISKEMVNPIKRREKGKDYFFVSAPSHMDMDRIYKVVDEALAK